MSCDTRVFFRKLYLWREPLFWVRQPILLPKNLFPDEKCFLGTENPIFVRNSTISSWAICFAKKAAFRNKKRRRYCSQNFSLQTMHFVSYGVYCSEIRCFGVTRLRCSDKGFSLEKRYLSKSAHVPAKPDALYWAFEPVSYFGRLNGVTWRKSYFYTEAVVSAGRSHSQKRMKNKLFVKKWNGFTECFTFIFAEAQRFGLNGFPDQTGFFGRGSQFHNTRLRSCSNKSLQRKPV